MEEHKTETYLIVPPTVIPPLPLNIFAYKFLVAPFGEKHEHGQGQGWARQDDQVRRVLGRRQAVRQHHREHFGQKHRTHCEIFF